jgi:hypothetical protein
LGENSHLVPAHKVQYQAILRHCQENSRPGSDREHSNLVLYKDRKPEKNSGFSGASKIDKNKKLKGLPSGGNEDRPVSRNIF